MQQPQAEKVKVIPRHMAEAFHGTRLRKRFLSEMVPLQKLLVAHGVDAVFAPNGPPTCLLIARRDTGAKVIVGIPEGERRRLDTDPVFHMHRFDAAGKAIECGDVNQWRGVYTVLMQWHILGPDDIPEDALKQLGREAGIRCACCHRLQPYKAPRFKQCRCCRDAERPQRFPAFNGFYCSEDCQATHWPLHRATCARAGI
jgi:hypothetical protein